MGLVRDLLSSSIAFVKEEIVPLRSDLIKAGIITPDKKAYDLKANLTDPMAYGSVNQGYKEKYSLLDYYKCRQITYADPIVASIIQTRLNQVAGFSQVQSDKYKMGYKIVMRDDEKQPSGATKRKIQELEQMLQACGVPENFEDTPDLKRRDNFEHFLRKITRDSLTFDQVNFEVTPRNDGRPYSFTAVDAATIRVIPDAKEEYERTGLNNSFDSAVVNSYTQKIFRQFEPKTPRYAQVINGVVRHTFDEWEMAFGIRNPRTDILSYGYGFSEIEMLITTITSHMNAETYNRKFFCLSGDTRIATEHGYLPIKDVCESGKTGVIWTGKSWTEFDVVKTGPKPLAITEFKNGHVIESSSDHQFRVYDKDLKLGWKRQSELMPDDYVVSDAKGFECSPGEKKIDSDLWELLGWIMADGSVGGEIRLHYRARDESFIRDGHKATLDRHGISYDDAKTERSAGAYWCAMLVCGLVVRDRLLIDLCQAVGFESGKHKGGHLPAAIFTETLVNRKAFLRGVFSGNGSATGNSVTVTFTNDRVLSDLRLLLSSVGFYSYATKDHESEESGRENLMRTLYVNEGPRFIEEVGFLQEHKTIEKRHSTNGSHIDPKLARDICRAVYGPQNERVGYSRDGERRLLKDVAQRSKLSEDANPRFAGVAYRGEGMSRLKLQEYLSEAGITDFDELLGRGFWKVKSATQSDEVVEMYDVCCHDDVHEFVAEGVVVHNSQGSSIKGVLAFEGDVPPDQLEAFRRQWYQQVTGVNNAWRTPIMALGKDNKLNWTSLHSTNREMEFGKWLEYCIKTICGVFQMDPIEIGFDISKQSSGQSSSGGGLGNGNQLERVSFSQDKGLRPLLIFLQTLINDYIVFRIDPNFEFKFVGLNVNSEKDDLDRAVQQVKTFKTINEVRAENDLPPLKTAEDIKSVGDIILDSTFMQFLSSQTQQPEEGQMPGQPPEPGQMAEGGEEDPGADQDPGAQDQGGEEPDYDNMDLDQLQQEYEKLKGAGADQGEEPPAQFEPKAGKKKAAGGGKLSLVQAGVAKSRRREIEL